MTLCFLGFGEAASEMARGLKSEGLNDIYAYDVMQTDERFGPAIHERVEKTSITLVDSVDELTRKSDFLFSLVPAFAAKEALQSVLGKLPTGSFYTDLTASTPDAKKEMAKIATEKGLHFTDGAMLGALLVYQHKVPTLLSGDGAQEVHDRMTPFGMKLTVTSENPGDASAVKLIRSIYMKGLASLVLETFTAADHFSVEDKVLPSLAETIDSKSFMETSERLITGTMVHAARRGAELGGSLKMLEDAGLDLRMTKAAFEKHKLVADSGIREELGGKPPKSWQEAVLLLNQSLSK